MRAVTSKQVGTHRAAVTVEVESEDAVAAADLLCGLLALVGNVLDELGRGRCPVCSCEAFCDCAQPCKLCAVRQRGPGG